MVQISDGVLTDTATVSVTVDVAPVALDDTATTAEDIAITLSLLGNDNDVDGDVLLIMTVGNPSHGAAVVSGTTQIVYTPTLNYNGADSFSYIISDGVLTDTATVSVMVNAQPVSFVYLSLVIK